MKQRPLIRNDRCCLLYTSQIGAIGKSGNVTGAHVHIEVFKLGTMSLESYASSWSGDLAFGAGWGAAGLNRLCANVGAPCRVKPETVFGY